MDKWVRLSVLTEGFFIAPSFFSFETIKKEVQYAIGIFYRWRYEKRTAYRGIRG
jgi:hypothetical protein